ncbi:hypothetical protein [uncultured Erythrobacter sp.]|nr:hypothetical protein [uncultured Erythrobacter sp.]
MGNTVRQPFLYIAAFGSKSFDVSDPQCLWDPAIDRDKERFDE